jgi:hypothetical protein
MTFSIRSLARHLGVTDQAVRAWIKKGYIEGPSMLLVHGSWGYPAEAAEKIALWYRARCADGKTRGPGAVRRRDAARAWFGDRLEQRLRESFQRVADSQEDGGLLSRFESE